MDTSSNGPEVEESGQPGVPTSQYPTNEGDVDREIAADVNIPGPYPSGHGDPTGEPLTSEPEPTKETRDAAALGDVVEGSGMPAMDPDMAKAGGSVHDNKKIPDTPLEEAENVRAESFPAGTPEDADVGTGRQKGQGPPPGSVSKGEDTPQTPAT